MDDTWRADSPAGLRTERGVAVTQMQKHTSADPSRPTSKASQRWTGVSLQTVARQHELGSNELIFGYHWKSATFPLSRMVSTEVFNGAGLCVRRCWGCCSSATQPPPHPGANVWRGSRVVATGRLVQVDREIEQPQYVVFAARQQTSPVGRPAKGRECLEMRLTQGSLPPDAASPPPPHSPAAAFEKVVVCAAHLADA